MLKFSRKVDYAVRVMVAITSMPYGEQMPAAEIGEKMQIPFPFLSKVVGDLRRGDLVETIVGRGGGIKLARQAHTITLRDIVEAVDGPLDVLPQPADSPPHPAEILTASIWGQIQDSLESELESINLAELTHRLEFTGSQTRLAYQQQMESH